MKKKITIIGGGTGSVAVLSGLKKYDDLDLSVIVSMTDDGGSNAVIRDQFGMLPFSDIRKSIIALSHADQELLRKIFTYRFDKGDGLTGHTIGNLIMMGLAEMSGSELAAIEAMHELFKLQGRVIPVTLNHARLVAAYENGETVKSEHLIDEPDAHADQRIVKLSLEPRAAAHAEAVEAIMMADTIIIGPGDLYTTTLANIIVEGIPEALQLASGKIIFINNLMTKKGQTHWMKAGDLVEEVSRYVGRMPDVVLTHNDGFPEQALERYKSKSEFPIDDDLSSAAEYRVEREDIVFDDVVEQDKGDTLVRSLIRHDPDKLARALYRIITS